MSGNSEVLEFLRGHLGHDDMERAAEEWESIAPHAQFQIWTAIRGTVCPRAKMFALGMAIGRLEDR